MSIKLMTRVWDETHFKGTELLILLCLADHANDDGVCWPSYNKLALRSRTSPRWARACVKRLVDEGFVEITQRGNVGRSNLYTITIPQRGVVVGGGGSTAPYRDAEQPPTGSFNSPPGRISTSTESSYEPSENHQEPPLHGLRRDEEERF